MIRIANSMSDNEVYQEVSDLEWMKGALLQASYFHSIGNTQDENMLLDLILDKLGISFHSRIADGSEIAINNMLTDIEMAFREFDSFSDERYTNYLNNQLKRTETKIRNVKRGIITPEKLLELMLMQDILSSNIAEFGVMAR